MSTLSPLRSDRLLVGLVLVLLVWLPLPLGSNRDWAVGILISAISCIGLLWCVLQLRQPHPLTHSPAWKASLPLTSALMLCQAWVAAQWLLGLTVDVGATFQHLMLGLAYSLLFMLVIGLFHTRSRITLLLAALVVSGTFQAFIGTFATLSGIESIQFGSGGSQDATGTFVNRNHLAGYLELCLGAGIGLLLALRDGRPWRWVNVLELILGPKMRLRLALVIMVIALVMTHSRGGNTGFMVGLLVAGLIFTVRDTTHRKRNLLILLSIVLIDVLIISQYFGLERLKERLVNTQIAVEVVDGQTTFNINDQRDDVVRQAIPLMQDKPLTGQGAGTFEAVFPRYADHTLPQHFDHAHNDYVQFWVEYGLLGSLPLAIFVLLALWQGIKALWLASSPYSSGVGFGATLGIVAMGTHAFTDFNLQIPANAATFVVLCATAVLARHHSSQRRRRPDSHKSALA